MAYIINRYDGTQLVVLQDGTIDTTTSLNLVGRNYTNYGEIQNENTVFLLENFAKATPPSRPISGQTWYDTSTKSIKVYDGANWLSVGNAVSSATAPVGAGGSLWLRSTDNVLHVFNGTEWILVGPEAVPGFGLTRAKATILKDTGAVDHAVLILYVNNTATAICASELFTIDPSNLVPGFGELVAGINLNLLLSIKGNLSGNATTASRLQTGRNINGTFFDGQSDITVRAETLGSLRAGNHITGGDFDGSSNITISVDATPSNLVGKIVARNGSGGFSAGLITADLAGNVTGNVNASSGTSTFNVVQANQFIGPVISGNSSTATRLETGRNINGVSFDGSRDITVPASAETLTGSFLNSGVTESSLTVLGNLQEVNVEDPGVKIGSTDQFRLFLDTGAIPTIKITESNKELNFELTDPAQTDSKADINFVTSSQALALGGASAPALVPGANGILNLGGPTREWNNVYANNFVGNASTATLATTATNIAGGGQGSLVYQTAANTTSTLAIGAPGYVLKAQAGNTIAWVPDTNTGELLLKKASDSYLVFTLEGPIDTDRYNGSAQVTLSVDATSANTASKVVARDASGNFSAGTVTANLTGNVTGNVTGNLTGTATNANFSTTQAANDNSTKIATTAYVDTAVTNLAGAPIISTSAPSGTAAVGTIWYRREA